VLVIVYWWVLIFSGPSLQRIWHALKRISTSTASHTGTASLGPGADVISSKDDPTPEPTKGRPDSTDGAMTDSEKGLVDSQLDVELSRPDSRESLEDE